jgi:hypothetical protein
MAAVSIYMYCIYFFGAPKNIYCFNRTISGCDGGNRTRIIALNTWRSSHWATTVTLVSYNRAVYMGRLLIFHWLVSNGGGSGVWSSASSSTGRFLLLLLDSAFLLQHLELFLVPLETGKGTKFNQLQSRKSWKTESDWSESEDKILKSGKIPSLPCYIYCTLPGCC